MTDQSMPTWAIERLAVEYAEWGAYIAISERGLRERVLSERSVDVWETYFLSSLMPLVKDGVLLMPTKSDRGFQFRRIAA